MLRITGIIIQVILLFLLAGCKALIPGWGSGSDSPTDVGQFGAPGGGLAPDANFDMGLQEGLDSGNEPGGQTGTTYAFDTLYAVPQQTSAAVGETVTVVIASGPPASQLHFINGIGLTMETGAKYSAGSFNVGAPGGAPTEADGFWVVMAPDSFLLPPDNLMVDREREIGNGRHRLDINITPIGGREISDAEGELVNIGLTFSVPGTYRLGFEQHNGVNRTYFSDTSTTEHFWGDLSNDHPEFANTVIVQ